MNQIEIALPKMGESITEAILVEWFVNIGDAVAIDDNLALIGTDKVESELPCEFAGTIVKLLYKEGETIPVGKTIAIMAIDSNLILSKEEEKVDFKHQKTTTKSKQTKTLPKWTEDKKFLSPVVRKIASEAGLDFTELQNIPTSGANGRIKKSDILDYLQPKVSTKSNQKIKLQILPEDQVQPLSRIRTVLANHLQESYQNIPHVTTFALADVSELVNFRNANKVVLIQQHNIKFTYTHLMIYLIIQNLERFPKFNAWMNGEELILKHHKNIGFATATPSGNLVVPNIKQAQNYSFLELANRINQMSQKAKAQQLNPKDVQDTSFTISNTGIFGSLMGTPIISKPQVAILALGEILDTPSAIKDEKENTSFEFRKKMYLSLSYDHRVIDGALASKFLTSYKNLLENFDYHTLLA